MRPTIIVAALALAAGCGSDEPDFAAEYACQQLDTLSADLDAGILTNDEVRSAVRSIYDQAQLSTEPGIAGDATEMLAGITSGDTSQVAFSMTAMQFKCRAIRGDL